MVVKRLPNHTISFLCVVRRCSKIDRAASSRSNYILPIRRVVTEGVVKLIVQRLPDQTIFFLYVVRSGSKIDREASSTTTNMYL